MPVIPRPAATVILMREISSGSVQTFLLKRHEANAFMGGNFVYPGGRMDPEDADGSIVPYCRGRAAGTDTRSGEEDADQVDVGYQICGIRELFEEAGILLAYDVSGDLCSIDSEADRDQFADYRRALQTKDVSMAEFARREKLFYALDQLFYVDRWITPEARNIRFDTRFYLAFCPPRQEASSDQTETVEGLWMSPREALELNFKGAIALSPPALETLEMLSSFESKSEILNFLSTRQPRTVLPILTKAADGSVILFPWDDEYGRLDRAEIDRPGKSRVRDPGEKITRVLLRDGRWLPCRAVERVS